MESNLAVATLYYDSCDTFLTDIGAQLEQALTPSILVQPEKILGGVSPLFPVLQLVITYAPRVAEYTALAFFTSVLNKAGEDFYNLMKSKLNKRKNDKIVLFTITTVTDEITVQGRIKFDNYESITKAIQSSPHMITDAYENRLINQSQLQEGSPIYLKPYSQSHSDFQIHYVYDSSRGLWLPESFYKPLIQNPKAK